MSIQVLASSKLDVSCNWESVAGINYGGIPTFKYEFGFESYDSKENEQTLVNSFEVATEVGYSFFGASGSVKMSTSLSKTVRSQVSSALTTRKTSTFEFTCPDRGQQAVLWQWHM
jgi:hypothetical protein